MLILDVIKYGTLWIYYEIKNFIINRYDEISIRRQLKKLGFSVHYCYRKNGELFIKVEAKDDKLYERFKEKLIKLAEDNGGKTKEEII